MSLLPRRQSLLTKEAITLVKASRGLKLDGTSNTVNYNLKPTSRMQNNIRIKSKGFLYMEDPAFKNVHPSRSRNAILKHALTNDFQMLKAKQRWADFRRRMVYGRYSV